MAALTHHEITQLFLGVALLLACARCLGELARRVHQPAVVGEILTGILLGPSVLGALWPEARGLFPAEGAAHVALEGLTTIAITLFLLVAGMEVDLSMIWRQGRSTLVIGAGGLILPFAVGLVCVWLLPGVLAGAPAAKPLIFTLFFATALTISALPVIAKILIDTNLYRTDIGMLIVSVAMLDDFIGWNIFGILLGMMGVGRPGGHGATFTVLMTVGFVLAWLTVGRWLLDRALPWLQAHTSWPGGVLGFVFSTALLCAAFAESIGIHAMFGAFIFGVAVGDSRHLRERTRTTLEQFISSFFAPLFFASIGLKVNFITNFDLRLVLVVTVVATVGKLSGCLLGARWSRVPMREAWAIALAMNARGAMGIILGLLGLQQGIIDARMFVALVVMALVTSMSAGSFIQLILGHKKPRRFTDFLSPRGFCPRLSARDRDGAITELSRLACDGTELDAAAAAREVRAREELMSTGVGNKLAIPHARLANLRRAVVVVGLAPQGIDFDAADGQPAELLVLILTPQADTASQLDILGDLARTFRDAEAVDSALHAASYTQFLAVVKSMAREGHRRDG